MNLTHTGAPDARLVTVANAAGEYGLTVARAREIIDVQVTTIRESWADVADLARLITVECEAMYGRQVLPRSPSTGTRADPPRTPPDAAAPRRCHVEACAAPPKGAPRWHAP